MNTARNTFNTQILTPLAIALAVALLTACSSGGDTRIVSLPPPPAPPPPPPPPDPPPPPPPPPIPEPCQPVALTADCVVDTATGVGMYGGRQSDFALIKRGTGSLVLYSDATSIFRFSGGTVIEEGMLMLHQYYGYSDLKSDVTVRQPGTLGLYGTVFGNVFNEGSLSMLQYGNSCSVGWDGDGSCVSRARIEGDYRQTATGTMKATLGWVLQITGRADLAGTLVLDGLRANGSSAYIFPAVPSSQQILHADGGVFGTFSSWSAVPGLFIDGSLRYAPNDVYFDLTRISLAATMARAAVGTASTRDSAANLDLAFKYADQFGQLPGAQQSSVQQAFLASAASIQHIQDLDQAVASLDSLSGQAHASANQMLLEQIGQPSQQLSARLDRLQSGAKAGSWVGQPTVGGAFSGNAGLGGKYTLYGQIIGYDQWLTDRLLVGSSFGDSNARMQFEQEGAQLSGQAPQWNAYLHYLGNHGWYASGGFGYGHSRLYAQRALDLGAAGVHQASSERVLDSSHAYAETGRLITLGQGQLTPFAAMGFSALHSEGFTERGDTGFELMVQPGHERQLTGDAGLRYTQDWQFGQARWLQLNFNGRYRQRLLSDGQLLQASFTGTPLAVFELDGSPSSDHYGLFGLGLAGGSGDDLSWFVDYDRRLDSEQYGDMWRAGMRVGF